MKKKTKIYIKLIKQLIHLNLLIVNPLFTISNRYNLAKLNFIYINPLEYIKNIKQFIRSLQFLHNSRNSVLYAEIDNKKYESFLSILKYNSVKSKYKIKYLNRVEKRKNFSSTAIYLYLRQNIFTSNYFQNLFKKHFYFVYSISPNFEKDKLGFYKIYNEFDEITKINFLIFLINFFYRK